jgi:hypothetical protein
VGPGPFQGQLLTLARQATTERKESKDLRGITDSSEVLSAVRGLKGKNFISKNKGNKNRQPKKKFKKKLFVKPQQGENRRQVYFQDGSKQSGQGRARTPSKPAKDQRRTYFQKKKVGESNQQL